MNIPPWVYKARTAIEGLIPRDGAVNAAVHVGFGLAAAGAAVGVASFMPDEDPDKPEQSSRTDFLQKATTGLSFGAAPLFLTAGMMFNTGTHQALARGVTPNYFLAAGAVLGAAYITNSAHEVLSN